MTIPQELNEAMSSRLEFNDPTPITEAISPGFDKVPYSGPSFPIAAIMVMPHSNNSKIFWINGSSRKSLLPLDKLMMSMSCSRA